MLQILNTARQAHFASFMPCIIAIVRATMRPGSTLRRFRRPRG
jgi:hypothetical protein